MSQLQVGGGGQALIQKRGHVSDVGELLDLSPDGCPRPSPQWKKKCFYVQQTVINCIHGWISYHLEAF